MEMEIPNNWTVATIPSLISKEGIFYDGDWVESKDQDINGDVRLIQLADIGVVNFRNKSDRYLTSKRATELRCTFLEVGDILVARMPDPIGRACIFPLKGKFVTVVDVAIIRPGTAGCDARWLMYIINSPNVNGEIQKNASGSTRLRISRSNLSNISFLVPPINEQKRIATKLDSFFGYLNSLNTKLDRIPLLIENFKQSVLNQAITGKLTEKWREGKELDDWNFEAAQDCCEKVQSGGTPKGSGFVQSGIPFLKVYNIVDQKIDFEYKPQFVSVQDQNSQLKKSVAYPGDVLMNIVGPPLGKVAIIPEDHEEWNLNQAITLFRPKDYLINKFLYYFLCEGTSVRSVVKETRGVVGQVNISLSQCRQFIIPIPPIEEQTEIVRQIEILFSKAEAILSRYSVIKKKIDDLPKAALKRAFEGELVEQDQNDEPADIFLKNINKHFSVSKK